jgi:uncharacterized membrane protein YkoI
MNRIMIAAALALPFAVYAADMNCSIKWDRMSSKSQLRAMAKISPQVAMKTALEKIGVSGAILHKGGLEVEDGCLVFTYDVKVPNQPGFQEVYIDAGTGNVLKVEYESDAAEAAESADTR